jgi:hypothetical protein
MPNDHGFFAVGPGFLVGARITQTGATLVVQSAGAAKWAGTSLFLIAE